MTNIHGIQNGVQPAAVPAVESVSALGGPSAASASYAVGDTIEISQVARLTATVHELPSIRTELVERVRAEIASGTYETPDRIDVALEHLLDEMTGTM